MLIEIKEPEDLMYAINFFMDEVADGFNVDLFDGEDQEYMRELYESSNKTLGLFLEQLDKELK